jgi:hypothetical protein
MTSRRGVTLLGFVSPGLALLAALGLGLCTFIPGAVASSRSESLGSTISDAAILAFAAALVLLTATTRIVADGDIVRVTNLFRVITIDGGAIANVETTRGLIIITTDGRRIGSFAYGASLAGDMLGYRRAQAAQKRCLAWLAARRQRERSSQDEVVVALRRAAWLLPAALLVMYIAEVLAIRAVT